MDRKFLIAANWKMNERPMDDVMSVAENKRSFYHSVSDVDVIVFPTFLQLQECAHDGIVTGAQWGHPDDSGAFTGDISMALISGLGDVRYVLCGHSERRKYHHETNEFVLAQAVSALRNDLHPIVCVGETEEERKNRKEEDVVKKQIHGLPAGITIAYEPVWAIGTGKTATPEDAQRMHACIRAHLPKDQRESTRILYGGSMNAANAEELLKQEDIDGGLIGGASLKPEEFRRIVEIAENIKK